MKRNDPLYYLINACFIGAALICVDFPQIFGLEFSPMMIVALCLLLLVVHGFKFLRMYFILLEEKLPLWRAIKLYVKTTFVSTLLPFKGGELFKMYAYGVEINKFSKGIIAVLIEKFFDAIVLCLILFPCILLSGGSNYTLPLLLLVFLIVTASVYWAYDGTYKYLNRFLVANAKSRRGIRYLSLLEYIKGFFGTAKEMLRGRQMVIMLLSLLSWIAECGMVLTIGWFMGEKVGFEGITAYISDGFFGVSNIFFNRYLYIFMAVFVVILVIVYVKKFISLIINKNRRKL